MSSLLIHNETYTGLVYLFMPVSFEVKMSVKATFKCLVVNCEMIIPAVTGEVQIMF